MNVMYFVLVKKKICLIEIEMYEKFDVLIFFFVFKRGKIIVTELQKINPLCFLKNMLQISTVVSKSVDYMFNEYGEVLFFMFFNYFWRDRNKRVKLCIFL
jgi:hypothetical protein